MELDPQQLKEKALLLLQRERELFELRMRHERVMVWLKVAQSLPQIFAETHASIDDLYSKIRRVLLGALGLQRVMVVEIDGDSLRPVAPAGPNRPFPAAALSLIQTQTLGVINDLNEAPSASLGEALGMVRFIWTRIDVAGGRPVVLAAGFDRAKAKFQPPIDAAEADNLRNAAQHIEGLVENAVLVRQVRAANETLELRVVERTTQLERRNHDMRLVLDNVSSALMTIDATGRLAQERSAKVDEWFGPYQGNPSLVEYIGKTDPEFAAWFEVAHEALVDGFMPVDLCLGQLPTRLRAKDRLYQCSYTSITAGAVESGLLVRIEDVTDRVRLEQEEAEQSELLAVFKGLMQDRSGFLTFFEEADRLVRELAAGGVDAHSRARHLHTLKATAAMMGAKVVSELCHRAEDELAVDGSGAADILARLQERWAQISETLRAVFHARGGDTVEISTADLERLCAEIRGGASAREIERRLASFRFEPVARALGRLSRHAAMLAERLGKRNLSVVVDADDLRVDPAHYGNLWGALVHLVRNAVDHGLESPEDRAARGKPEQGHLALRATHTGASLAIEIEDDGSGIDWEAIARLARDRGLPHSGQEDLLGALLSDGFTTRSAVTSTSGRGVGMSAVRQEVTALGGELSVRSEKGKGTCWRVVVPLTAPAIEQNERSGAGASYAA